jgi:hypothetical protein
MEHEQYYPLREEILLFLEEQGHPSEPKKPGSSAPPQHLHALTE